jgi:hypothetical protein
MSELMGNDCAYLNLKFCTQNWYGSGDQVEIITAYKVTAVGCNG